MIQKKKQICVAIILFVLSVYIAVLFYSAVGNKDIRESGMIFSEGWEVSLNEEELGDTNLETLTFPTVDQGEIIVLQNKLPDQMPTIATLRMLTYLAIVEVSVDNQQIYQYGREYFDQKRIVGSGYHFVQLPQNSEGKSITVTLTSTEDKAFTNITPFEIIDTPSNYTQLANEHKLDIFVGLFLLMMGVVLSGVSSLATLYNMDYLRLVWIGLFSCSMGIWTMCSSKILQFFCQDIAVNTSMEYISLYFAPIPFFLTVINARKGIAQWKKYILNGIVILMIVFAVGSIILQETNVLHFPMLVSAFHVIAGSALIITILLTVFDKAKMNNSDKILYIGILIMFILVIVDLARFNIQKYVFPEKKILQASILPMGTLLFVTFMIISYIVFLYDMILSKAEKDSLTKLAYRDSLTGLYNRAKCEELFHNLDETEEDYAIINFDINGLKQVNDNYGHSEGDILIQEFANLLMQAFGTSGKIVRMGGDEFIVIVKEKNIDRLEEYIAKYNQLIENQDVETKIPLYASFGISVKSTSGAATAGEVYEMADSKMYDMKGHK